MRNARRAAGGGPPVQVIAANRQAAFFDVVYGNNAVPSTTTSNYDPGFNAGVGFDLTTGLGAPFARNLIKAVVGM